MTSFKGALLGFVCGVVVSGFAACGPTRSCTAATCSGCCDANATCQGGFSPTACGSGAVTCVECLVGTNCIGGLCTGGSGGGAGGGGIGGGSGGGTGGGTGGGLASLDAFCQQAGTRVCAYYVRCGLMTTQASCEAVFGSSLAAGTCAPHEQAAVTDGRASFDGARLQRCFDAIATAPCTFGSSPPVADCDPLVDGLVALGQSCFKDFECLGDAFCTGSSTTCPGQCRARVALGADAGVGDECVDGAYLSLGRCVARVPIGGSCAGGADCVAGAFCDPASSLCRAPIARGQPCTNPFSCADALACTNGTCGDYAGTGQLCQSTPYIPCKLDLFCAGASTGVPGTCKAPSSVNGPCGVPTEACAANLYCTSTDGGVGTCLAPKVQGQGCAGTRECGTSLYCDVASTGACQPRKASGASCALSEECRGYCSFTTCAPYSCEDPTP